MPSAKADDSNFNRNRNQKLRLNQKILKNQRLSILYSVQLSESEQLRIKKQFEFSKFSTIERKTIALRIFRQKGSPSEEYLFQLTHVSANCVRFFLLLKNVLVLPVSLNKLRIGQEVELREITQGERICSHLLEILNRPISWWLDQPGFETLLVL